MKLVDVIDKWQAKQLKIPSGCLAVPRTWLEEFFGFGRRDFVGDLPLESIVGRLAHCQGVVEITENPRCGRYRIRTFGESGDNLMTCCSDCPRLRQNGHKA